MPAYLIEGQVVYFSHIPKCGGTSVETALRAAGPEILNDRRFLAEDHHPTSCSAQHFHAALVDRLCDRAFFSYRFAVVRDPVARMISEFRHRMDIRPRSRARTMAGIEGEEPDDFDDWVTFAFEGYARSRYIFDNHVRPQSEFVTEDTEIFRLEDGMEKVFARLSAVLGQTVIAPATRKQVSTKRAVSPSTATLSRIHDFYASDYGMLAYDKASWG